MQDNAKPDMPSLRGSASDSPYMNFPSFMGCELTRNFLDDDVDVVVSGVPFDLAFIERPGARFGPTAIRQASTYLAWELCRWPWNFNVFDELGVVDCGDLSFDPTAGDQMVAQLQQHTAQIMTADKGMLTLGGDHNAQDVLKAIRHVVENQPAYVTFDVDCLDPSCAPGTGAPVVGGLSTDLALKIIRGLVGCHLIGMDIVEVSLPYDHAAITSLAAATLGLELLYVLAANRKMK